MERREIIKELKSEFQKYNILTGNHKKTAQVIYENVANMVDKHGIERVTFITLTFDDRLKGYNDKAGIEIKEAEKRFNSLATNVLKIRYEMVIKVTEWGDENGRIHFHLIAATKRDIKTGLNWEEYQSDGRQGRKYLPPRIRRRSANNELRQEWAFWMKTKKQYGFGYVQLDPIRTKKEAIARYVGGYISKNVQNRTKEAKGARVVSYLNPSKYRVAWPRFGYRSAGGWAWRQKLKAYCEQYNTDYEGISKQLGARWCYQLMPDIKAMNTKGLGLVYPSKKHAELCGEDVTGIPEDAKNIRFEVHEQITDKENQFADNENHDPVWSVDDDPKEHSAIRQAIKGGEEAIKRLEEQHNEGVNGFQEYFRKLTPEDRIRSKGMKEYDYKKEAVERWNKIRKIKQKG